MYEDFMQQQGTVIPTMFIGLGGIGSRIVDRIADRAMRLPNWELQLRGLTTFVALDTNKLDLDSLKVVPSGYRIHIGAVDKQHIVDNYRKSNNRQALHWIDRNYRPRPGEKPGAGQIRVESRLGYHYASPSIRTNLENLVRYTLDPSNNWRTKTRAYYVYLFASLGGGTGSGSFLPVAYLIQDILRHLDKQPRVIGNFVLSTMLTHKVQPDLHLDIHANTYAALKELEHMMKLGYPSVQLERPEGEEYVFWNNENATEIPKLKSSPFFHAFLFDRPSENAVRDVEVTIADSSFLQLFTPVINTVAGYYDNYEKHLQSLTHFAGENKNVGTGYAMNYGAFGTAALVLPAADLLEYCALRFAAEALRRQITFGTAAGARASERERALDRLKVNYNDPAFRNLDESARFERINDSFLNCVQTMADFDDKDGYRAGYWYRLVEDVDRGRPAGTDNEGKEIRTESLSARVLRLLDEARKVYLDQVNVRNRSLVITRETVNQYQDFLSRVKEDVRTSTVAIEAGKKVLQAAGAEGEVFGRIDPRPTPMQERYLVIQLLKLCDSKLIPEARDVLEKTRSKSFTSNGVLERIEREIPRLLEDAAQARKLFPFPGWDEEGFVAVRNSVGAEFPEFIRAQTKYFDADLKLAQYVALRDYLAARARQFAMLSAQMNDLVTQLDSDAESVKDGVAQQYPRLELSVEIFETIENPRRRIWSDVYEQLFLAEGRELSTFDRQTLATAISAQLEPVKDRTGVYHPKPMHALVADLKRSMVELGKQRLRPTIFGDQGQRGLTLESGLELEARIMLPSTPGVPLPEEAIQRYMEEKFKSLHLMAALLSRTRSEQMRSLDDGVKLASDRHFLLRQDSVSSRFNEKFRNVMANTSRTFQPNQVTNPHLALVHDVELPVPLYYFPTVVGEIQASYEQVMANDRRQYQVHTDFNWEYSLPNLDPNKAELQVTASMEALLDGIITKVFVPEAGQWIWRRDATAVYPLGRNLSAVLYEVVKLLGTAHLGDSIRKMIQDHKEISGPVEIAAGLATFRDKATKLLEDAAMRKFKHESTREDELESPILRALVKLAENRLSGPGTAEPGRTGGLPGGGKGAAASLGGLV
ncbi:MAG: hypothetical protein JNK87_24120 [Bryobacterales bacterium]|nr:hypothetical protein [Bryobacterales bacterium]